MAFIKRNWLARIGIGLNKFVIGDRDSQGKQTLTNSPDSVTQEGDVISADNLNDLEDRIEAGFNGMKLTKIWENEDPTSAFSAQTVIADSSDIDEILVVFNPDNASIGNNLYEYKHIKFIGTSYSFSYIVSFTMGSGFTIRQRTIMRNSIISPQGIYFDNGKVYSSISGLVTQDNTAVVPIAIYKVGDIYNS